MPTSRRLAAACLLTGLLACTPSTAPPQPDSPRAATPEPPPPPAQPPEAATPAVDEVDLDCEQSIAQYLKRRTALNHCERDEDCSEIWPGLCPHDPYYIHRDADIEPVWALARSIEERCEIPECEPPIELGPATCRQGRCERGRAPAPQSEHESCWDYEETYLESPGAHGGQAATAIQGITPHLVIVPEVAGPLQIDIDWPPGCTDCTLLVSEHQSGVANLLDTTPKSRTPTERNGDPIERHRIELRVTPSPYHLIPKASKPVDYFLRTRLLDASGKPAKATRHGTAWIRMCEG